LLTPTIFSGLFFRFQDFPGLSKPSLPHTVLQLLRSPNPSVNLSDLRLPFLASQGFCEVIRLKKVSGFAEAMSLIF
jgi:hypothetical protein